MANNTRSSERVTAFTPLPSPANFKQEENQDRRRRESESVTTTRLNFIVIGLVTSAALQAQAPLRIFIRASEKTHGGANGNHDHPAFLESWSKLLTAHGAVASRALRFPAAEEPARTDVLIDYSSDGANFSPPKESYLRIT
jgi:hypothetical protein